MANELTILSKTMPALPAEVAKFFDDESNVAPKNTTPTLSIEGKTWTINLNGEKTKLMRQDPDTGDATPVGVMRVVVLDYNQRRGRAYYEGAYDPAAVKMPVCWSDDGIKPDHSVEQKQHPTCEGCPLAAKGSKVTEGGKATKACAEHRMVVVVPANNVGFTPLRMKLPITSDWDKSRLEMNDGWYGFQNYTEMLRANKVNHTAKVVTKMRFDPDAQFPKVLFAVHDWVTPEQAMTIIKVAKTEAVTGLLKGTWTPDGSSRPALPSGALPTGTTTDVGDAADQSTALEAEAKAKADAAVAAEAKVKAEAKAKRKAEKEAAAAAAAEAAAKAAAAAASDDDEDGDVILPGAAPATNGAAAPAVTQAAAAPKPPQQVAPKANAVPSDVEALLNQWGE